MFGALQQLDSFRFEVRLFWCRTEVIVFSRIVVSGWSFHYSRSHDESDFQAQRGRMQVMRWVLTLAFSYCGLSIVGAQEKSASTFQYVVVAVIFRKMICAYVLV